MGFDPLSWAIGFTATRIALWMGGKLFTDNLPAQLRAAAEEWAKQVPEEIRPYPDALFPELYEVLDKEKRPCLAHLRKTLNQNVAPTRNDWLHALKEQWEWVRTKLADDAHIFFQQPWQVIEPHLSEFATKLYETCIQDRTVAQKKMLQELNELRAMLESITQPYSLEDIVNRGAWHRGIPIQEVINEPLEEEPLNFIRPLLVAGHPNVGKTCWVFRQAWHWLQSYQTHSAAVFLINASQDEPSLVGTLVRTRPSEAPVLIIIDDVHYARSNPRQWVDELKKARNSRLGGVSVVWVARDAGLQAQLCSDNFEEPEVYPFLVDRVLDVLGKRLHRFTEWQRVVVALETVLDPRLARRFPPRVTVSSDGVFNFVRWVNDCVHEDTANRIVETKAILDKMDANAFALYTVLLPAGSINYPLPYQFIREIGHLRLESVEALIRTGLARKVGVDCLVLTEHPFQIRQTLKQEGLLSVPAELGRWFKHKVRRSSLELTVSGAVLAGYLVDPSQAGTRLDEFIHYAEWSGVRQPVADALKILLEHTDWSVDGETKEKATATYHTLTRKSFPEDGEQLVNVLKSQRAYWEGLWEAAEQSGELKVGSERLDRILYEIAYIDYLLEHYDQAADTFHRSVNAALEAIARGIQADPDDPARKDGSDALARFWISAMLEKSAALRHHIRQYLSEGEAAAHYRTNTIDVSRIVKEAASIWHQLREANLQSKEHAHPFYIDALRLIRTDWQPPSSGNPIIRTPEMEKWLARHEHNTYLHSREMSCWPMLFGLSNQRIEIDVPEPEEHRPSLNLSTPDVGLPFYRAQGIDLLCRWTQHSNPSELSDAVLATAAMMRAGGGYEYLGDLLLLGWLCTPSSETADMLKWYLHNRIPSVGFNGLTKTAMDAIESARRSGSV